MKTTPLCLILASCLGMVCATGMANEEKEGQEVRDESFAGKPRPAFAEVWQKTDRDGNGMISREEFESMPRLQKLPQEKRSAFFDRLDQNHDGVLAKEEIQRLVDGHKHRRAPMPKLWELDQNQDGAVEFEEFQQAAVFQRLPLERQRRIFRRLDGDGDGRITPHEPQRGDGHHKQTETQKGEGPRARSAELAQQRPSPEEVMERFDTNGDQILSWEEFRGRGTEEHSKHAERRRKRFDHLDQNRDGQLTLEELSTARQKPHSHSR